MPSLARRVALAALAALALLAPAPASQPASALAAPVQDPEDARPTGQVVDDGELIDHDYAFALREPGRRWSVMAEADVQVLVPDGCAGMSSREGVYLVVIVEHIPIEDVDAFADLTIDSMPLEYKRVLSREAGEHEGHPCVRYEVSGRVEGLSVVYSGVVFARGEFAYQVLSWSLRDAARGGAALEEALGAFRLLDADPVSRVVQEQERDDRGVDWRVLGGVFESAAYGVRLRDAQGWSILTGERLAQANEDASVGAYDPSCEAYAMVIAEVAAGVDEDAFRDFVMLQSLSGLGVSGAQSTRTFTVGGVEREFSTLESTELGGFGMRFHYTNWMRDGVCTQVIAWSPILFAERADESFARLLAGLEEMSEGDRAALHDELSALPDEQDHVGPSSALRGGVFREFDAGVEWRRPVGSLWKLVAGDAARRRNADTCLYFECQAAGLYGQLIAETDVFMEADELHEFAVQNVLAVGEGEVLSHERYEVDEVVHDTSRVRVETEDGIGFDWLLTTVAGEGRAIQLMVWGTYGNLERSMETAVAARDGLRVHPGAIPMVSREDGRYVDHRLGFSLRVPRGNEPAQELPTAVRSIATGVEFADGAVNYGLFAVWMPTMSGDTEGLDDLFREQFRSISFDDVPRWLRSQQYESEPVTYAGLDATRIRFERRGEHVEAVFFFAGKRLFGLIGGGDVGEPIDLEGRLTLLP